MSLRLVSGQKEPIDHAAHWVVRNLGGALDAAERAAFAAWLAEPGNAEAYARAEDAFDIFADIDALGNEPTELEALRNEARAYAPPSNRLRWRFAGGAIAACLALAIGFTAFAPENPASNAPIVAAKDGNGIPVFRAPAAHRAYATATGEQRVLLLEDGTRVTMNTGTQIAVNYRADRRIVRLIRGQALFDIAHNPARPFSVIAADRQVTALGTVFEVRLDRGRLQVTLVRGRVMVTQDTARDQSAPPPSTYLNPGQQLVVAVNAAPSVARVDVDKQLLWRQSLVEFNDVPVAQAAAELNRYSLRPIVIADPRAGAMRISGVFRTGDPAAFSDLVGAMLPISASENGRGEIELRSSSAPAN
jgi:transmembrane sensor